MEGSQAEQPVTTTGDRPLRADAVRNRRRILDAAEAVFARDGVSVPIDEVAQEAGVGVGTLYRHFPTKEELFEAIALRRIDDLLAVCDAGRDRQPTDAFFGFLRQIAEEASLKHDLIDALGSAGSDFKTRCADKVAALEEGVDRLRARAVEAGGVRADVTTTQVLGLVMGACRAVEGSAEELASCEHMLDVVFDGLRTLH